MRLGAAFWSLAVLANAASAGGDWLINPVPYKAAALGPWANQEVVLQNGLVKRRFSGDAARTTVALDNQVTGESLLRSARPEALVELNGQPFKIGGLVGQPAHNFLKADWLDSMKPDPLAWHCVGLQAGQTQPRFDWLPRKEWLRL